MRSDEKASGALEKNDRLHAAKLDRLQQQRSASLEQVKQTAEARRKAEVEASQKREAQFNVDYQAQWQKLEAEWKSTIQPIFEGIVSANELAGRLFPPWKPGVLESWAPPAQFAAAAKFAQMEVEIEKLAETTINDKRLASPGPSRFAVPLCLAYPGAGLDPVRDGRPGA